MRKSIIKDINLAESGHRKIEWVKNYMPVLSSLEQRFIKEKPFKGKKITMSIHLEAKTAYLAKVLKSAGAEVAVTGSNPLSTQDDVCAALIEDGLNVYAWYGTTSEEYNEHLNAALDIEPNIIIDDGGDLIELLHTTRKDLLKNIIGGSEETTTGVLRLKAREKEGKLALPMVAANDAYCKYLFDNRYGTGQSVWDGIMRTTNLIIAGKNVVVFGYGWCGKGVANKAKGLGANIIVCEVDPIKAIEACMDGLRVMPSIDAAKIGDIFVTVTGDLKILTAEHFKVMKDGVIMANSGHFDCEIWKPDLDKLAKEQRVMRNNIIGYVNTWDVYSVWTMGKSLIIDDLYISKEFRNNGYGKRVMNYLINYAISSDFKRIQLSSEKDNIIAQTLYKKIGFADEDMVFFMKKL